MPERGMDEIYARIPHEGPMRLIDRLESWDDRVIRCTARSHADPSHPLRHEGRLAGVHALEYAAQAIAIHAGLLLPGSIGAAVYVAAFRDVDILPDAFDGAGPVLAIEAERHADGPGGWSYGFCVSSGERRIARGRALLALGGNAATGAEKIADEMRRAPALTENDPGLRAKIGEIVR